MGEKTAIQWTDHTFNYAWGCQEVSPGCAHCYARMLSERWGHSVWGANEPRRVFGPKHWDEPLKWNAQAAQKEQRHRVFTSSMADVFEDHPMLAPERAKLWSLIAQTPWLDWQVLTKRPEYILEMVPPTWLETWPRNVWIGTSTENAEQAALRMVWLIAVRERTNVPVLFASAEPLLGAIDFTRLPGLSEQRVAQLLRGTHSRDAANALAHQWRTLWNNYSQRYGDNQTLNVFQHHVLDWVIVGGESGSRARPMNLDWARSIRDICQQHDVAYFFKQVGGRTAKTGGSLLDGQAFVAFPA